MGVATLTVDPGSPVTAGDTRLVVTGEGLRGAVLRTTGVSQTRQAAWSPSYSSTALTLRHFSQRRHFSATAPPLEPERCSHHTLRFPGISGEPRGVAPLDGR